MRHPLDGYVKAELAYRADFWSRGRRDNMSRTRSPRTGRRFLRGRYRRVAAEGASVAALPPAPTTPGTPTPRVVVPLSPRAPRRHDAA
jgi:hypothetical protein